ncbi:sugar kinase [Rhizobium sp. KVB221]|uniref:Sugar kinase n=1 Tax=Rhizobium setariae TaxID=2801340 RepID=A0A936YJH4_9HYPH|nr:sugar kinase [Rhizobium setariae]MBL0371474.1 sugar kinase [Rhizobium setariae]
MSQAERPAIAPEALGPAITIGEILVEIMADAPGLGFLEPLALTGPFPSGAPAIFIDQLARMGASAGIIAAVGADDFGTVNIRRLADDGVDVSAIAIAPQHPTGTAFVRYKPDGGRDFVFNIALSAAGEIHPTEQARALIGRAGHLHLMGTALTIPHAWPVIQYAMDTIRSRGGSFSFDPNVRKELLASPDFRERFAAVLARADVLLPSGDELFAAAPAANEPEAVTKLLDLGISEIVLKRGASGATVFTRAGRYDATAYGVEEIDPTGAGDCFGGAYIACRRLGLPIEQALDYANAAGAIAVTARGPMEGASTRDMLEAFMNNAGRM